MDTFHKTIIKKCTKLGRMLRIWEHGNKCCQVRLLNTATGCVELQCCQIVEHCYWMCWAPVLSDCWTLLLDVLRSSVGNIIIHSDRDVKFGHTLRHIVIKWDKSKTFFRSVIFAPRTKMYWNWSLKIPHLSHFVISLLIWPNLIQNLTSLILKSGITGEH